MNFRKVWSGILATVYLTAVIILPLLFYPCNNAKSKGLICPAAKVKLLPIRELADYKKYEITVVKPIEVAKPTPAVVKPAPPAQHVIMTAMTEPTEISRGGLSIAVEILEGFQVTWYNNEGITYTTASGARTVEGQTIGVDPRVIPLGTWVEIYMPDGRVLTRKAEDTGSAVKGRIIDVYADASTQELNRRGRTRDVVVKILRGK